jgi:hypothetical protein
MTVDLVDLDDDLDSTVDIRRRTGDVDVDPIVDLDDDPAGDNNSADWNAGSGPTQPCRRRLVRAPSRTLDQQAPVVFMISS